MDHLEVFGPAALRGSIRASGAKNATLPALAATLLTEGPVVLESVPRLGDVETMLELLGTLGVVPIRTDGTVHLRPCGSGASTAVPRGPMGRMRAGVLALGSLLGRHGRATLPLPGGCSIGARPIDQHLAGFEALGARIRLHHDRVEARVPGGRLRGGRFRFAMPTVTGTENLILGAVLARGTSVLENCAREPEVADLALFLEAMGARIEGAGSSTVVVEGVDALRGARHRVMPDRIESGTYLVGAALTHGDVTVMDAPALALATLLDRLETAGARVEVRPGSVRVAADDLQAVEVETAPHPGFPTDLQAPWMVLATQARGLSRIRETVFDGRFRHASELRRMGATVWTRGRRARVAGPAPLRPAPVAGGDLRATAALVLAGLCAPGITRVRGLQHLDRGYEDLEGKLRLLGVRVERRREHEVPDRWTSRSAVTSAPGSHGGWPGG